MKTLYLAILLSSVSMASCTNGPSARNGIIIGALGGAAVVEGLSLREAEGLAIARAALKSRALPREMDVRHLHECRNSLSPTAGCLCA